MVLQGLRWGMTGTMIGEGATGGGGKCGGSGEPCRIGVLGAEQGAKGGSVWRGSSRQNEVWEG